MNYGDALTSEAGRVLIQVPNGTGGNHRTWTFSDDGHITFSGGGKLNIKSSVPVYSTGEEGDLANMIALDSDYLYYCISDYEAVEPPATQPDIWKRVQFSNDTW